ncbi:MAG: portal protein [Pseudomonadota bacterium]
MDQQKINEQNPEAEEAIRRWDELRQAGNRIQWEQDAEDIARLIRPQRGGFGLSNTANRKMEKPLSSEPVLAQSSFAAGIYSGITNPANRWVFLETGDEDLNSWQPMAEWNDLVTRRVLGSFAPAISSFYSATYQAYSDIAAFGNAAGYDEVDRVERRFTDVTVSLANVVVDIDAHGRVVEVVYRFVLKARAAVSLFKNDSLPDRVYDAADKGKTDEFTFFRHIKRNEVYTKGSLGPRGKRWLSITACETKKHLVRRQGYDDMPFYFPRWDVESGHTMGTGPGFIALASARTHQLMDAATIRGAQYDADPTTLAPDRETWPLNGRIAPGQVVYGGMDQIGRRLVSRLERNGSMQLTESEKAQKLEAVKNAFHYAIMSLQGRTGVTDEETRIMDEARLRNWAPHADRIMEEYAARKVERRFGMLWTAGQLPPPPEGAPPGTPMRIRYQSAAQAAMRAREGQEVRGFLADITPLIELNPRYADRISHDDLIETLHDARPSLPASILTSRETADQAAQERAQRQQAADALAAGEQGAGIVRDLSQAGALQQ